MAKQNTSSLVALGLGEESGGFIAAAAAARVLAQQTDDASDTVQRVFRGREASTCFYLDALVGRKLELLPGRGGRFAMVNEDRGNSAK